MKRYVIGTFSECMKVIRANKKLKTAGYDYHTMEPCTREKFDELCHISDFVYTNLHHTSAGYKRGRRFDKFQCKNGVVRNSPEFYLLTLYRQ